MHYNILVFILFNFKSFYNMKKLLLGAMLLTGVSLASAKTAEKAESMVSAEKVESPAPQKICGRGTFTLDDGTTGWWVYDCDSGSLLIVVTEEPSSEIS